MDRANRLGMAIALLSALHLAAYFLFKESPVWFNVSLFVAARVERFTGALPGLLVAFAFTTAGLAIAAAIAEQESRIAAGIFLLISLFEFWARLIELEYVVESGTPLSGTLILGLAVSLAALLIALLALWVTARRRWSAD